MSAVRADLFLESMASEHGACGYHHRHVAETSRVVEIARAFRDAGYLLEMITCEDRRAGETRMRLVYQYNRLETPDRHVVFADVVGEIPTPPDARPPSVASVYPAADWLEREVYDMYGVSFEGHPNLQRILLPEDADFHALLKDFGVMETPENGQTNQQ